ncbi:hypothetical protein CI102_14248 [Trichoderma harzianum]|nr:hypothetical protein CI102_14248 [Trichoderma harzianum]
MSSRVLLWLSIVSLSSAALPWSQGDVTPGLQTSSSVSFDPLAVLAILWNPRASVSASRLYSQPHRSETKRLRWPHLMQIGAATVPVSVLVGHFIRNYRSILFIPGGLIFSVLLNDIWGVVLFGTYLLHWVASTAVSFCQLVESDTWKAELNIRQDDEVVFAIYERPAGGWVIFKGTQETMERWARTSWWFADNKLHNKLVHWSWMITGLLAALASVANMVNMTGYMQLGFLGILVYGSLAELWLTVVDQMFQPESMSLLGPYSTRTVAANDKKYKSIIQACLGVDDTHRLGSVPWTALGLLPNREPFLALEQLIRNLHKASCANGGVAEENYLDSGLSEFDNSCKDLHQDEADYSRGIRNEVERVWRERIANQEGQQRVEEVKKVPV